MAEHCVLCRKEILPTDSGKTISIQGKRYPVCSACKQWYQYSSPEEQEKLRRQALTYMGSLPPKPTVSQEVPCPACGEIMKRRASKLQVGSAAYYWNVDLYACPQCGKVELYMPGYPRKEVERSQDADAAESQSAAPPAPSAPEAPWEDVSQPFWKRKKDKPEWED